MLCLFVLTDTDLIVLSFMGSYILITFVLVYTFRIIYTQAYCRLFFLDSFIDVEDLTSPDLVHKM